MKRPTAPQPPPTLLIAAFAAIYLVWGSTYLAIRVAVETLPPFLSAACRFLVAGGLLLVWLVWRGYPLPNRSQWRHAATTGLLLLLGGNGLVVWAERTIPSGLTALLIALTPVWFALIDWWRPGGNRPQLKTAAGILTGLAGVIILVGPKTGAQSSSTYWLGTLALIAAGISWAGGSLYSKYNANAGSPWVNSAAQMICGGAGLLGVGLVAGEPFTTEWSRISGRSIAALGYLIVFGSWIGFSAYVWLLKVTTPSRVATYAYVNPVIALFLGWLLLDEVVSVRMLWGSALIVAGVVVITAPTWSVLPAWRGSRNTARTLLRFVQGRT